MLKLINKTIIIIMVISFVFCLNSFAQEYNEAPMLREKVEEGKLPPVEERLPDEPFVVGPGVLIPEEDLDWQVGEYGGTLRSVHLTPNMSPDLTQLNFEGVLDSPGILMENIQGNIFKDYEVNEDNTKFTFYLRKGLKWSDGHPVTTEDVLFAYEDMYLNEDVYPIFPQHFKAGGRPTGEPMELEVLDDYTFTISFDEPYGGFLAKIALRWRVGVTEFLKPKHYLKQFHIDYTSLEEMKPYLEEEELDDEWWELLELKDIALWESTGRRAIDYPVLFPWMRVESSPGRIVMKRNPYYFKVDTEGNQLPYIDTLRSDEVSDEESVVMKIIAGEADFVREDAGLPKMPLFRENEEKGGYETRLFSRILAPTVLIINYTYEDPEWQEVVSDIRFRKALTLGIDREEILESVYYNQASKPEWVPNEYNPEKAKQLLDDMGLDEVNEEGYRLGPDGEPFELIIEVAPGIAEIIPTTELAVEHIKDIGIKTSMKQISFELLSQRTGANEVMSTVAWLHPAGWPSVMNDYLPGNWGWGQEWNLWYNTSGDSGEEPPDWIKEGFEIYEENEKILPTSREHTKIKERLHEWWYNNIVQVMIIEEIKDPLIIPQNLKNVAHSGYSIPAYMCGEQYYFEE